MKAHLEYICTSSGGVSKLDSVVRLGAFDGLENQNTLIDALDSGSTSALVNGTLKSETIKGSILGTHCVCLGSALLRVCFYSGFKSSL